MYRSASISDEQSVSLSIRSVSRRVELRSQRQIGSGGVAKGAIFRKPDDFELQVRYEDLSCCNLSCSRRTSSG